MTIFQAIVLGIVQGFTEFLPISSSAHLYLVPYIFGWNYQGLGFDVALHWGTLLSILIIFLKDYIRYVREILPFPQSLPSQGDGDKLMAWYLVLGSIPAALAGFFFQSQAETVFRNPWITVVTLSAFGILLWVADRRLLTSNSSLERGVEQKMTWKKVLFIGFAQALAIVPGVSRSGATITAGLFSKLSRQEATRFAFLLSGPIVFGAGLVSIPNLDSFDMSLLAGFIASATSGFIAIKFLLRYVGSQNFNLFVWYRILFAGIIALSLLMR
ncbi:MAG: hypothetical protein A2826_02590 [Candidatus Doudnabacteria bacterium RIFCSPHIGHO2_01_FULL_43_23]|uniref:Undecaprenyl-diphosphatase n=1 Tax=Candidatus Doudnabacteria bacterium RIFCSPHIGHO2_01_FULL_43_23 TaxID=1817822 RepID=A0A1F5NVY7_9BACT|nr:MAG: hypothetical protein A2826_02590 [Candidatus Doudnabacteria bacterium RIFCSPHIGHO2_01_FULL_43_23]